MPTIDDPGLKLTTLGRKFFAGLLLIALVVTGCSNDLGVAAAALVVVAVSAFLLRRR